MNHFFAIGLSLLLLSSFSYVHAEETKTETAEAYPVHGSISLDYRMRATSTGLFDHDLWQNFALNLGDPYANRVSANFLVGYIVDLDGHQHTLGFHPLGGIYDGFKERAVPRIYYGYVHVRDPIPGALASLDIGRQQYFDFESLYFDGVKVDSSSFGPFSFNFFGGVPVHNYETIAGENPGDWLTGGGITLKPIQALTFRLDYVHLHDDDDLRPFVGNPDADLFSIRGWAQATDHLDFYAKFSSFTDELRDATFRAIYHLSQDNFTLQLNYFTLFDQSLIRPFALDSYSILGPQFPYHDVTVQASKIFATHFMTSGGAQVRILANSNNQGTFNHEFQRYFVTLSTISWPWEGTSLSVTGDYYNTFSGLGADTFAVSGEIEQKFLKQFKAAIGTSYSLYQYNFLLFAETDHVRDYYARLTWKITQHLDWKLRYTYEDIPFINIHDFRTGLTWSF